MNVTLQRFSHGLETVEEKTKSLFVFVALALYAGSLIFLAQKISPVQHFDLFLIKALGNLSIPFGVILLQEFLELISTIAQSRLRATCQQFEIVALVILRSFFKEFGKLNEAVSAGLFNEPTHKALVKMVALLLVTMLILHFRKLSRRAGIHRQDQARQAVNQWQQLAVVVLCIGVFLQQAVFQQSLQLMVYIAIVFTGMIVIDGLFFLWSILSSHEFDSLMFDGGLVVSLIFARFPLFAPYILSYVLAIAGIAFATVALHLFVRPKELEFLGNPQEDDVARQDLTINNQLTELRIVREQSEQFLKQFDVSEVNIKKVRLACEELLGNVISYAYDKEGVFGITVSLALCKDRLVITLTDNGKAFNPFHKKQVDTRSSLEDRELGGLGIHLVRNAMDQVSYSREAGRNVVTLLKHLSEATPVEQQEAGA
ncbi:MAG: ATP-binding protein [Planctomycetota bacterium]|jgi:anti-sigma regulatory factor (Ser/Thr protein kinase)